MIWVDSVPTAGSSPLTRGKRLAGELRDRVRGLIPAHAGKTWMAGRRRLDHPAHPRSRGENVGEASQSFSLLGSSPLTRGKHGDQAVNGLDDRLIPAHAGKTSVGSSWPQHSGAHPRSRGENASLGNGTPLATGSSPLTRGKLCPGRGGSRRSGLIPAHAGKTPRHRLLTTANSAHPRSRGENHGRRGGAHR